MRHPATGLLRLGLAGLAALAQPALAAPAPRDQAIPSCFERLGEYAPRAKGADLTVLVDQTAYLDARLRQIVHETVERLVVPGTNVSIAVFSGYLQGRYLDVLVSGQVEAPIDAAQRDFVSKRDLRQNEQCLEDQLAFARRLVGKALDTAFKGIDPGIARSDILVALRDLSRRSGDVPADRRILVVVSDMIENSSITSFYHDRALRRIDPEAELRKIEAAGVAADFASARVFVIGAGGVSNRLSDDRSYRDPLALISLEAFWRRWFAANHAELVEFGTPTPLIKIDWSSGPSAHAGLR